MWYCGTIWYCGTELLTVSLGLVFVCASQAPGVARSSQLTAHTSKTQLMSASVDINRRARQSDNVCSKWAMTYAIIN